MKKIISSVVLFALIALTGCVKRDPVLSQTNVTMHIGERLYIELVTKIDGHYLGPDIMVGTWTISDNLKCTSASSHGIYVEAVETGDAWVEAVVKTCNGNGSNGKVLHCDITVLPGDE